jgi:hypothetical protein
VPPQPAHAAAAAVVPAVAAEAEVAMSGGRVEPAPAEAACLPQSSEVADESSSPKPVDVDDASVSYPPLARAAAVRHCRETRGCGPSCRPATLCRVPWSLTWRLAQRGGVGAAMALPRTVPTLSHAAVPPCLAARGRAPAAAAAAAAAATGEAAQRAPAADMRHAPSIIGRGDGCVRGAPA